VYYPAQCRLCGFWFVAFLLIDCCAVRLFHYSEPLIGTTGNNIAGRPVHYNTSNLHTASPPLEIILLGVNDLPKGVSWQLNGRDRNQRRFSHESNADHYTTSFPHNSSVLMFSCGAFLYVLLAVCFLHANTLQCLYLPCKVYVERSTALLSLHKILRYVIHHIIGRKLSFAFRKSSVFRTN